MSCFKYQSLEEGQGRQAGNASRRACPSIIPPCRIGIGRNLTSPLWTACGDPYRGRDCLGQVALARDAFHTLVARLSVWTRFTASCP